ncbi:MAG: protein of unknown function transrane [Gemmatimonadales bacterium]|nr:protein of unknown function transrane [Gemmatimonadales bacterium]
MVTRVIAGAIGAGIFAFAARKAGALSTSGAFAGTIVGAIALAAGWGWGLLLVSHFISASALSKLGEKRKAKRIGAVVEKGDRRDAKQVLANGGVYALSAIAYTLTHTHAWYAVGIGALAASAADTWATEIGTLFGRNPRSIVSGEPVPAGTSGGVSLVGTIGSFGGALFIATGASIARWPVPFAAVVLGGLAGAMADSLLGATLQTRRWCDVCAKATERPVHSCGNRTRRTGGLRGFDNDAVNAVSSGVGALVTLLLS